MASPVTLKIKFKAANLQQFIERYAVDVSKGGIFIRTPKPLAVGTTLKFEFQLQDGAPLLAGNGTVVWIREADASKGGGAPGMGVRFDQLPPDSQGILDEVLTRKQRAAEASEFSDQPTRVADLSMADLGAGGLGQDERAAANELDQIPGRGEPALAPEPVPGSSPVELSSPGLEGEQDEPSTRPVSPPSDKVMVEDEEEGDRKDRLARILFTGEHEADDQPEEEPEEARRPTLERSPGPSAARPVAPPPEPRSSMLLWIVIVLFIGAGAFLAYKFLGKKSTGPDEKQTFATTVPDSSVMPDQQPAGVTMRVNSEPPGAKILVDGKETGQVTPAEVSGLDPEKEIEIRLDLPGKKLFATKLKPAAETPVEAKLDQPSERRLQFVSVPAGATVTLDGKKLGPTPQVYKKQLDYGKPHQIGFNLAGHLDVTQELKDEGWIRDGDNEVLTISVTLEKKGVAPPPEPKPETKTAPLPEPKPEAKGDPGETKTEPRPAPKPRPRRKPKKVDPEGDQPEPVVEPRPEPKPAPKEEPKDQPKGVKKPSWME